MIKMKFNKSQKLIIGTIATATFGFPDINRIFTEEIIKLVMKNPSSIMILLVSILKILLVLASIYWLIQLIKNISLTHTTKSKVAFQNYFFELILTVLITLILMIAIKIVIPI
ncbi:hypothetical protein CL616_05230 [archaeon]|nr:hypothetical protein [archaeon]